MSYRRSKYLVTDGRRWLNRAGTATTLVYSTRSARLVPLDAEIAELVLADRADELDSDTAQQLLQANIIVPAEQDETAAVIEKQRAASNKHSQRRFTLLPTTYCNMGCEYCGQHHRRSRIGRDHRDAVVARIERALSMKSTESIHVTWFGGEPLMGYDVLRDIARRAVALADSYHKPYQSMLVTNGALLDQRKLTTLLEDCRVTHIEVTLDGPAEVHDRHRPLKSGQRSFDRIVATLTEALHNPRLDGLWYGIRTNVDVNNEDAVDELIDTLADAGLAHPRVRMHLHPVHSWENDVQHLFLAKQHFAEREVGWLEHMRNRGIQTKILPGITADIVCGAVTRATEVTSGTGNMFSCTELPLVDEAERDQSLAQVTELAPDALRPSGPFDNWHSLVQAGQVPCQQCRLLPVCGGACPKAWQEGEVPCPSLKVNAQQRVDLAGRLNGLVPVGS